MPRKPWVPLPHEADLFCNVFVDESSQTKLRYLVIGGLIVPHSHFTALEADLVEARGAELPTTYTDGKPRVIKWAKVNPGNVTACERMVEAYRTFPQRHRLPVAKDVDIHCVVVDTSKKPLKDEGDGDLEIGFNKQVYFLCVVLIRKRYKRALFHFYLDRRTSPQPLSKAHQIMTAGAKKYGDKRDYPIRRLRYEDPERCQCLQLVDLFIGAVAYKLNGHYGNADANPGKKRLCDFILSKMKITDPFVNTPYYRRRLSIVHRPATSAAEIK